MSGRFFYFGAIGYPGHYWFACEGRVPWGGPDGCPWRDRDSGGLGIDGRLAPRSATPTDIDTVGAQRSSQKVRTYEVAQGIAALHCLGGWTAISFWDRTADKRGACNSNFVVDENLNFEEMVERSKAAFPKVWARFPFPIVEWKP